MSASVATGAGVDEDETEIGGSRGRRIQKRAARGSRKANPKRRSFTEARRRKFLNHFAATCNIKGACRSAGVSNSTVHEWRRKNEQFRTDFRRWRTAMSTSRRSCSGNRSDH
jgi:hypothetical protein